MAMEEPKPDPLDIPAFLKRDVTTRRAPYMSESVEPEVESRPAKSVKAKANGAAQPAVKAAGKPKAKAVAKAPAKAKTAPKATVKAAKAPAKAKVAKPKAESTVEKDMWGFRKGSSKSQAAVMYARKSGATLEEVKEKVGSVQLNLLKGLEEDGHTVERKKEKVGDARAVTRYFLKAK